MEMSQERKEARESERCELAQQEAVKELSERERRAMAAEKRILTTNPSSCGSLLTR